MYKRPIAYVCAPGKSHKDIFADYTKAYCKTLFEHGYTPFAPALLFPQFVDLNVPDQQNEAAAMNKVLLRKSRIMFVCGDHITPAMQSEMLYAKDIGITIVTIDSMKQIEEYLAKSAKED